MANPKSDGRMIRKDISESEKYAALTPEAAVLFAMLIPHFGPYGKMNGGPGYIKEIVCPKIPYLTIENLPKILAEIGQKTNVKWFEHDKRYWIHSLSFLTEHQQIEVKKLGKDRLPDYSATSRGLVADYSPTSRGQVAGQCECEPERECEREPALAPGKNSENVQPEPSQTCDQADHAWKTLTEIFPKRHGKLNDLEECKIKFLTMPALHGQMVVAARYYGASREVADGAVMNLLTFIRGKWKNWTQPEQPSGAGPPEYAPDYSWKDEDAKATAALAEEQRMIESGELKPADRGKLPWQNETTTN